MHSLLSDDGKESNKAKGINTATKDTLFNKKVIRHKMKTIQSKKHKILLFCFDDKRFVLDNGIHTLAYFHKDLRK